MNARERAEYHILHRIKRYRGEPEWRPTGILSGGRWWYDLKVDEVMRRFNARRTVKKPDDTPPAKDRMDPKNWGIRSFLLF